MFREISFQLTKYLILKNKVYILYFHIGKKIRGLRPTYRESTSLATYKLLLLRGYEHFKSIPYDIIKM